MSRALVEVSRLTRPARLRCRPSLGTLPSIAPSSAHSRSRGLTTTSVRREELAEKSLPPASAARRTTVRGSAERRDYEASLQLSRELDALDAATHGKLPRAHATPAHTLAADAMRKSKLPSLLKVMTSDLKPFTSGSGTDAAVNSEAGPSKQPFTVHAPPPSRKGKERAVDVSEDTAVEAKPKTKRKPKAKGELDSRSGADSGSRTPPEPCRRPAPV